MDLSFIKHKWYLKLLGTLLFALLVMLVIYLVNDDYWKYIIAGSLGYLAGFALIWVAPISFIILFLETKIHLISEDWKCKKYITKLYSWVPNIARKALVYSLYLILSATWMLLTSLSLIMLGVLEGG